MNEEAQGNQTCTNVAKNRSRPQYCLCLDYIEDKIVAFQMGALFFIRRLTAAFKTKLVLEALEEQFTIHELGR